MTDTDDDPGEVTVSLRSAEQSVPAGEETTLALTVEGADSGISAYESAVTLDGAEVAPFGDTTERYTVRDCAGATLTVGDADG